MNTSLLNKKTTVTISLDAIPIAILFLCTALTGFLPQSILSVGIMLACVAMLFQGNLYLAYPFMIFYAPLYGAIFGFSVYRMYTLLMMASLLLRLRKNSFVDAKTMIPFGVYIVYALVVVTSYSMVDAVYAILNVVCCVAIAIGNLRDDPENLRKFFKIYVLVALVAAFTGIMGKNTLIEGNAITHTVGNAYSAQGTSYIDRFTATFEDPNYMGFFYTIAVFATISLKLFKPLVRWIVIIILYVTLLSSVSITAVVVNVLMWIVYLLVSQKINVKVGIASLVVVLLVIGLYQYGLENRDAPVIGDLSYRIHEKLMDAESGDVSSATTGRTDLAKAHLEYYWELPLWKQLLGGTPVNVGYIAKDIYGMAHNEYVDMLLNIGIIGTALMIWFIIHSMYICIKQFRENNDDTQLCRVMCKCIWLAYAATLTMFLEYRFMLPFFI